MIISVIVKLNQKEQKIELIDNIYKVSLKSKPIQGRANAELIKLLSKYFNKQVVIKSGLTSKKKRIELI